MNTRKATKRKAVLMLSTEFQRGHSKAGESTQFVDKLASGAKLHTIRSNYNGWARKAERINAGDMVLSVRIWSGKPYRSPQYEVAVLQQLHVQRMEACYTHNDAVPRVWIDGREVAAQEVAKNDGLTLEEWVEWMFAESDTIEDAAVLQFTNFKY